MNHKFLYFLAAVLLCMTSCKKDGELVPLNVTFEGTGDQKVFLNDSNYVFWSGHEKIKVNGVAAEVSGKRVNVTEADEYYAVYPASEYNTAASTGGSVDIPTIQYYQTYKTADGKLRQHIEAPMAGCLRGYGDLYLRNLASLIRVVVKNKTQQKVQLHNIVVSCDVANLSGKYNYSFSNSYDTQCEEGIPTGSIDPATGNHAVMLYFPDTTNAAWLEVGDSMTFFLVSAPFAESQGKLRAVVTTSDVGTIVTYTKTNSASPLNLKRSCVGVIHMETQKPDTVTGGVFSVSPTKKVTFAPGNLYHDGTGWHLYDYEYIYNNQSGKDYLSASDAANSLSYTDAATGRTFANDFWELLTDEEWDFLLNQRKSEGLLNFIIGSIAVIIKDNGQPGLMLIPDQIVDVAAMDVITSNLETANYHSRTPTVIEWATLEAAGCVFLPYNIQGKKATNQYYINGGALNPAKYALDLIPDNNADQVCSLLGAQSNYLVRFAKPVNINYHDN